MLITCSSQGPQCRTVVERGTGEAVHIIQSMWEGIARLREREYEAIIIDEDLAKAESECETAFLRNIGFAIPVYVNLGVCGAARMVSDVKAALRRRQAEKVAATRVASSKLRDELRGAVTGILLSSELAMSVPELPRAAQVKLKFVYDLAQGMRRQLEA